MGDEEKGRGAQHAHRREVAERVVGQLRIQREVERRLPEVGDEQRVAIGGRLGDELAGERSARAGLVLDHDLLAEVVGEPLRDHELIHNYVLMGLSHAEQGEIEDEYWMPIEHDTSGVSRKYGVTRPASRRCTSQNIRREVLSRCYTQRSCCRGQTSGDDVTILAERLLAPVRDAGVDTLLLGCTHYPLLTGVISYVMGEGVTLVSSAEETAKDLYKVLVENQLLRENSNTAPTHEFLATGDAHQFEVLARRFLGPEVTKVQHQDL